MGFWHLTFGIFGGGEAVTLTLAENAPLTFPRRPHGVRPVVYVRRPIEPVFVPIR